MKYSDDIVEQIRSIPLLDVVARYGIRLKRSGSQLVGLCPFHDEKTPSFFVSASKGYKCFGCGTSGGNAIDFIIAAEGKDFAEACEQLAGIYGIIAGPTIKPKIRPRTTVQHLPLDFIPFERINENLTYYNQNNLYEYFAFHWDDEVAGKLFRLYGIGSSSYFGPGTTMFAQHDINGNYRQVKVILYDPLSGKRRKDVGPRIIGRDKRLAGNAANLVQCFFGEHLLALPESKGKSVALVESEKTAAICSIYYPQFLWLATGGKNGCNMTRKDVNTVLRGRRIHLFPDVDGVRDWHKSANELKRQGFKVFLNDVMARNAPAGSHEDIADLILRAAPKMVPASVPETPAPGYPPTWDNTVPDLSGYWAQVNHLLNQGLSQPKALEIAKNEPMRTAIAAGFDNLEIQTS